MFRKHRWVLWLLLSLAAAGALLFAFHRAQPVDFDQDPSLVFVREFHTHLLEPGVTLMPRSFSNLNIEERKLVLTPRLWQRLQPAPLLIFHQVHHLDLLVAEQLHSSRGPAAKLGLNALPQLLPALSLTGGLDDLTAQAGMGLVGGHLNLELQDDGSLAFSYRDLSSRLALEEVAFLVQIGSQPWTLLAPGSEDEVIMAALEEGVPMSGLAVFNLGPWRREDFLPAGGV